jgi:hypothetical protein
MAATPDIKSTDDAIFDSCLLPIPKRINSKWCLPVISNNASIHVPPGIAEHILTFMDLGDMVSLTQSSSFQRGLTVRFIMNARRLHLGPREEFGISNAQQVGSIHHMYDLLLFCRNGVFMCDR